jgi:hypothetical protein
MTPWADLIDTFNREIQKGNDGGRILWNGHLDYTAGNVTSETFVFPRLGAIKYPESEAANPIQVRVYIVTQGIGIHDLTVRDLCIK